MTLKSTLGTSTTSLQNNITAGHGVQGTDVFSTLALSADGNTVYVGGTDGIVSYSWSTTDGLSFEASAGTPEGVSNITAIEQSPAAAFNDDLYAMSSSNDTLYLLNATTLASETSLSGSTQQGSRCRVLRLVVSSDGLTVFVAGQDSDAISIFNARPSTARRHSN